MSDEFDHILSSNYAPDPVRERLAELVQTLDMALSVFLVFAFLPVLVVVWTFAIRYVF